MFWTVEILLYNKIVMWNSSIVKMVNERESVRSESESDYLKR